MRLCRNAGGHKRTVSWLLALPQRRQRMGTLPFMAEITSPPLLSMISPVNSIESPGDGVPACPPRNPRPRLAIWSGWLLRQVRRHLPVPNPADLGPGVRQLGTSSSDHNAFPGSSSAPPWIIVHTLAGGIS